MASADGVILDARDAEVRGLGPQRQHEVVVGELPPVGGDAPLLEVQALHLGAAEAGAVPDQGPPQRLRHVLGVYVAADAPGEHGPEGEEVLPRDDHDPDIVAPTGHAAQALGGRVPREAAA
jgi:hypothetical protein